MFPKLYKIFLLVLFACSFTFSQTGRVSGKIIDQQTGEALIGANIIIVGTSLGAASDVNGEYLVTNLNAGQYSVKASYIGYQDVTVNNVNSYFWLNHKIKLRTSKHRLFNFRGYCCITKTTY